MMEEELALYAYKVYDLLFKRYFIAAVLILKGRTEG
jgi:hypothetical protein